MGSGLIKSRTNVLILSKVWLFEPFGEYLKELKIELYFRRVIKEKVVGGRITLLAIRTVNWIGH